MAAKDERKLSRRVLLLGSKLFADALTALCERLESSDRYKIVGRGPVAEASTLIAATVPHVILMAVSAEDHGELAALGTIGRMPSPPSVILLCDIYDRARIMTCIEAGADACIHYDGGHEQLAKALVATREGRRYMGPRVSELLMRKGTTGKIRRSPDRSESLTPREAQVVKLLAGGLTGPDIARKLRLSAKTVHAHRTNVMRKLRVHNVAQLVRRAIELDLAALLVILQPWS